MPIDDKVNAASLESFYSMYDQYACTEAQVKEIKV